jgi:hypothetical protein
MRGGGELSFTPPIIVEFIIATKYYTSKAQVFQINEINENFKYS